MAFLFAERPGETQPRRVSYAVALPKLSPTALRVETNRAGTACEQIDPPPELQQRLEAQPEAADLISPFGRGVRAEKGVQPFLAQGRAGVRNIQPPAAQEDMNAAVIIRTAPVLTGLQQRVGPVLHKLENLPVTIAAGKHGFLDAEVLFEQPRIGIVGAQTLRVELF